MCTKNSGDSISEKDPRNIHTQPALPNIKCSKLFKTNSFKCADGLKSSTSHVRHVFCCYYVCVCVFVYDAVVWAKAMKCRSPCVIYTLYIDINAFKFFPIFGWHVCHFCRVLYIHTHTSHVFSNCIKLVGVNLFYFYNTYSYSNPGLTRRYNVFNVFVVYCTSS